MQICSYFKVPFCRKLWAFLALYSASCTRLAVSGAVEDFSREWCTQLAWNVDDLALHVKRGVNYLIGVALSRLGLWVRVLIRLIFRVCLSFVRPWLMKDAYQKLLIRLQVFRTCFIYFSNSVRACDLAHSHSKRTSAVRFAVVECHRQDLNLREVPWFEKI